MSAKDFPAKRWWFALSFFVVMSVLPAVRHGVEAAGKPCGEPERTDASVVARFDGRVVTTKDFETRVSHIASRPDKSMSELDQKRGALETLLRTSLFALEAKEKKFDQDEAVRKMIQEAEEAILANEFVKRVAAEDRKVTDEEIGAYYRTHEQEFTRSPMVRARHIMIGVDRSAPPEKISAARSKAQTARQELSAGADFIDVARKYSDDGATKHRGGDLGYITEGRMGQEFFNAAYALTPGELSEPVQTEQGFHIIKLETRREGHLLPLASVSGRIRSQLAADKEKKTTDRLYETLKEKYHVDILEDNLKRAKLKKSG